LSAGGEADSVQASRLLRSGLLEGVCVLVAGAHAAEEPPSLGAAAGAACARLGARVLECRSACDGAPDAAAVGEAEPMGEAVARARAGGGPLDLLAIDAASLFARAASPGEARRDALRACLEASWELTHAAAEHAFLAGGRGGRIVYLAPPPTAGEHAEPARAGLENLARTLSIEWARYAITAVAIAPAAIDGAACAHVGALVAYLASPAGAYFSGCLLDLRGVPRAGQRSS
jgi:NAD(P)-dependent dehydrogenase (short-subunit alcohol dehydrogenase family)